MSTVALCGPPSKELPCVSVSGPELRVAFSSKRLDPEAQSRLLLPGLWRLNCCPPIKRVFLILFYFNGTLLLTPKGPKGSSLGPNMCDLFSAGCLFELEVANRDKDRETSIPQEVVL